MLELIFLILIIIVLVLILFYLVKKNSLIEEELTKLKFKKQSQSVKYGKITEEFFPLMEKYPFNPEGFRFLGSPIDGIQFNDDSIIFVEFKAGESKLNLKQKKIKKLVEDKKVKWREFDFRV